VSVIKSTSVITNEFMQKILGPEIMRDLEGDKLNVLPQELTARLNRFPSLHPKQQKPVADAVVVYNPVSPDSIITAAIVATKYGIKESLPAGDRVVKSLYKSFYWVGVEPSKQAMSVLRDRHHHGFFYNAAQTANGQFTSLYLMDRMDHDDDIRFDIPYPKLLLSCAIDDFKETPLYGVYWNLANNIDMLEKCNKKMPLLDQAIVFQNVNAAMIALTSGTSYCYIGENDTTLPTFLTFLKTLKIRVSQVWSTTAVQVGKKTIVVPAINIGADLTPWAIKLISCTHADVITYETNKNRMVYTVFSRTSGGKEAIMRYIAAHVTSTKQSDVVFSGEM
jgi:hypothetical protein